MLEEQGRAGVLRTRVLQDKMSSTYVLSANQRTTSSERARVFELAARQGAGKPWSTGQIQPPSIFITFYHKGVLPIYVHAIYCGYSLQLLTEAIKPAKPITFPICSFTELFQGPSSFSPSLPHVFTALTFFFHVSNQEMS